MVDYYFLTTIRQTFLDFYTIILNSLVNVEFFEGQREEFEIIGTTPVGFFDWYIRSYPLESGKHIFWKKDETHVWVKFMGTFTVKDHKLYVTVPDESMYALARVQFFAYIYAIHYHKVGDFFPKVFLDFQREIIRINASREIYFSEDPKRELILRTWLLIKNWDFSALENKIKNLKDSGRGETFSRENLILGDNPQETMKTLDLLFTIYFVNFFLYSLVKDSPEFFVDMFYSNYGYWAPHRHIFQDLVQMDVSSYYAEFLNYSHNLKDSDK